MSEIYPHSERVVPNHYELNPILKAFWQSRKRNKVLHGGRASSKSHDAAGMAVFLAANYSLKFLCIRQFQNKISDSVYTLLVDKINSSEYKGEFKILNNSIVHKRTGSEFLFYGIARNLDEIKSTEGVDICWLEEAHALTAEQWRVIEPTIRKDDSEMWIIFNPGFITDFVWQNFIIKQDEDTIVQQINYTGNPFLSKTMLRVIDRSKERMDDEEFEHVYLGVPLTNNDRSVIPYKYLIAATDAHIKLGWPEPDEHAKRTVGYDVADDGDDLNSLTYKEANIVRHVETWKGLEDELLKSCARVYRFAAEHGAEIMYDCIGVGATCGSKFSELNDAREGQGLQSVTYHAFNAGGGVTEPDEIYMELPHMKITRGEHYENAKAVAWDEFAQKLRNTYEAVSFGNEFDLDDMLSFDSAMPNLEALFMELSTPFKGESLRGKFMVESKKELRKRDIPSPNMADSTIMSDVRAIVESRGILDFW